MVNSTLKSEPVNLSKSNLAKRQKFTFVDSNGNQYSDLGLGKIFERSPENRADIEARRPGTFVVPKNDLLAAIKRMKSDKS